MFRHLYQGGHIVTIVFVKYFRFSLPLPQLLAVRAILSVNDRLHLKLSPQQSLCCNLLLLSDGFDLNLKDSNMSYTSVDVQQRYFHVYSSTMTKMTP